MSATFEVASIGHEFAGVDLVGTAGVSYKDPDEVRFGVSLQTAEAYRDAGLPYVVIDASPQDQGDWVAQAHKERGAYVFRAEIPGIATQRQQGVAFAVQQGAQKIVGSEPEKPAIPLFADVISEALDHNDVLVIGRTSLALETAPGTQQRTEHFAGWILEQTHRLPPDALAGPRGFTVAGAEVLRDYRSDRPNMNNWIYLYDTPIAARRIGLPIGGIAVDMTYPDEIVEEEYRNTFYDNKRFDQFTMQLRYLLGEGLDQENMAPGAQSIAWLIRGALPDIDKADLQGKFEIFSTLEQNLSSQKGYVAPLFWSIS
jgi:hypothetical protein